jgi:CRISPR-associated protein Csx10
VEDKSQRPTEKVGGLFFYEAIREGQIFRGIVKIKGTVWKKIWGEISKGGSVEKELFKNESSIGRSRKDEYGRVRLEAIPTAREIAQNFDIQKTKNGESYLVVYLLSDVLIRGSFQEYSTQIDDLRVLLEEALGLELNDIPANEWSEGLSPLNGERGHCVRIGRRESWHTRWTLPRPSLLYFQAGSILLFKIEDPTKWKKDIILKVMNEGIGERRAEGYGRVWIDPPFLREERGINVPEDAQGGDTADAAAPVENEVREFIVLLEMAHFRRVFARNARREIYNLISSQNNEGGIFDAIPWGKNTPSASQFGALREAAALGEGKGLEHIERLLKMDLQTNPEQKNISRWSDDWWQWLKGIISNRQCIKQWNIVSQKIWDRAKTSMRFEDKELGTFALLIFIDILCEAIFDRLKHEKRQGIDEEENRDEPRPEGEN